MSTKTDPADHLTIAEVRAAARRQVKLEAQINKGRVLSVRKPKKCSGFIAGFDLGPECQFDSDRSKIARGDSLSEAIDNLLS